MTNELDHVSHSQLNLYDNCPRAWKYRYIDRISSPSSPPLVEGDCYHKTLEYNFKYKMNTGDDIDVDFIPDIFIKHWTGILENSNIDWQGKNPMHVRDEGIALACKYVEEVAPDVIPAQVERWFETWIEDTKFVLRADLICVNGSVIDHKTAGKRYTQKSTDDDMQASAIAYVMERPIVFYHHIAVKKKAPEIQVLKSYRTQADIDWWLEKAECTVALMKSGYYPPNITSWLCSEKYCTFHGICRGQLTKIHVM